MFAASLLLWSASGIALVALLRHRRIRLADAWRW